MRDDDRGTRPGWSAARIAGVYLVVATVWIVASDFIIGRLVPSIGGFVIAESVKGLAFITVTALVLYYLVRRGHHRIQTVERDTRHEMRFQQDVLTQVSDAVAFAGIDGKLKYVNSSALRLYGVEPGDTHEMLNRPFEDVVDFAWSGDETEESCRAALFRDGRWRGEILLRTRHRRRVYLDCDITLVKDDAGQNIGALAIARDVTEQRRAERKLRRSEERLALHFELVPLAAVEWDERMTVLRWNDAAETIFGYSKEQMIGRSDWELLVPQVDRARVREVVSRLLKKGEPVSVTNLNITKDGREIVCEWFNTPLIDDSGKPIGIASLAADITDRLSDQDRLRESLRVQRLLLSELDHRVKNALSGLVAMVDLTRNRAQTINDFADAVRRRVEAMARVHAMLSQSKWTSLDLRAIVDAMSPAEAPGKMVLDGPPVEIPVRQATPLGMTVQELMSNSLKHGALSLPDGRVRISWRTKHDNEAQDQRRLRIEWEEFDGPRIIGQPVPGLGSSLIEGFCRFELGGEVDFEYRPEGAHHKMRIVLDDGAGTSLTDEIVKRSGPA